MRWNHLAGNAKLLLFQRNVFLTTTLLLALALCGCISLLFFKQERVIIAPPVVEREFWVDGKAVSASYLEQFGCFLGQLLLSKSPNSAAQQRSVLLRHADPSFLGVLRQKLLEEEALLTEQNAAYVFYPTTVTANPTTQEVRLEGDRVFFIGERQSKSTREAYIVSFRYTGSRLLISGIRLEGINDA